MYMIKKIVCGFAVLGVLATSGIFSTTQDAKAAPPDSSEVCFRLERTYKAFWSCTICHREYNHRVNGFLNRCSDSKVKSWGESKASGTVVVETFEYRDPDRNKMTSAYYSHFTSVRVSSK